MAERKGVRECVEALNIKRRELEKERERLCQVHHQRYVTHTAAVFVLEPRLDTLTLVSIDTSVN